MPASLSFREFQQAILRGRVEPVYLFDGDEEFFHEEGIRILGAAVVPEGSAVVDRDTLRGAETTLDEVLDLASTYPMGGGRRLIVVRGAAALRGESPARLHDYLGRPNPRSCLVFSDPGFDRRKSLHRALAAGAARLECAPLDPARMASWVRDRLRSRGFGLTPDLAEAIVAGAGGTGLARLDSELTKLMSAIGEPRPVEARDLVILADVPRVADAFRLAARIARGGRGEAIVEIRELLRSGEAAPLLLGGMSWYFRNALRARLAGGRRLAPREATALYGIDPGRIERFTREIGQVPPTVLVEALRECLRADREIKGAGSKDPAHALERLAHRIGRRAGEAR